LVYTAAGKWTEERSPLGNETLDGARHQARHRPYRVLLAARQADDGAGQLLRAQWVGDSALAPTPRNKFVQKALRVIEPMEAGNTCLPQSDESAYAIVCVHPVFLSGPTLPVHRPRLAL
jgi:hypothetical protein